MIAKINNKILKRSNIESSKHLTLAKTLEAANSLQKAKSPGLNGIYTDFYQEFEYTTERLYNMLKAT